MESAHGVLDEAVRRQNAYAQGVRRGRLDGLKRARDLARGGLHVDPRTSLGDFIVAIELIIAEEAARAGQ